MDIKPASHGRPPQIRLNPSPPAQSTPQVAKPETAAAVLPPNVGKQVNVRA